LWEPHAFAHATEQASDPKGPTALCKPLRPSELRACLVRLLNGIAPPPPEHQLTTASPLLAAPVDAAALSILVAEDNEINRLFIVELLKQLGYTCQSVTDGRQAIAAVERQCFEVILMDCEMPEVDGFEATRQIRRLATIEQPTIVALTANAVDGDRERCLDAGMDAYLCKPVGKEAVRAMLHQIQGKRTAPDHANALPYPAAAEFTASPPTPVAEDPPPINIESLFERCFDNLEFAESLLEELAQDGPQRLAKIEAAYDDTAAAAKVAHALKGAAGILCATRLQAQAWQVEQVGRTGDLDALRPQLTALADELRRCLDRLPEIRAALHDL
jgi:Amt family ammonium transporter